jgi:hypothetical protein
MSKFCSVLLVSAALLAPAQCFAFDSKNLYCGGGFGSNHVAGSERATGFQLFAGYKLFEVAPNLSLDAEAGVMTSGKMKRSGTSDIEATSVGATGVARYLFDPKVELLVRGGYFAGDQKNIAFGAGAGYIVHERLSLRLEYVQRFNTIGSVLVNLVYRP